MTHFDHNTFLNSNINSFTIVPFKTLPSKPHYKSDLRPFTVNVFNDVDNDYIKTFINKPGVLYSLEDNRLLIKKDLIVVCDQLLLSFDLLSTDNSTRDKSFDALVLKFGHKKMQELIMDLQNTPEYKRTVYGDNSQFISSQLRLSETGLINSKYDVCSKTGNVFHESCVTANYIFGELNSKDILGVAQLKGDGIDPLQGQHSSELLAYNADSIRRFNASTHIDMLLNSPY
ncbi:MAG: hypothetical protein COB50_05365 [Thiotrichales bacterium]|nr:MAG: hypothetical protein COB50_05365 [Thiotrichales bacterium]